MQQNNPSSSRPIEVLAEAIRSGRMIEVTYNGNHLTLEPYQIFLRGGAVYLSAFNPDKKRRSDEAGKLGYFNITGLSDLAVTSPFDPSLPPSADLPREDDALLLAIATAEDE